MPSRDTDQDRRLPATAVHLLGCRDLAVGDAHLVSLGTALRRHAIPRRLRALTDPASGSASPLPRVVLAVACSTGLTPRHLQLKLLS